MWACRHIGQVTKLILIDCHFLVPKNFNLKFDYKWPSSVREKQVLALGQGQGMTLTLNTHVVSFNHLAHYTYQFSNHRLQ